MSGVQAGVVGVAGAVDIEPGEASQSVRILGVFRELVEYVRCIEAYVQSTVCRGGGGLEDDN